MADPMDPARTVERLPAGRAAGDPTLAADAVRLTGLRFRWPGAAADCLAIDHFRLAAGERVFLLGPNGSGKSSLLSLIGGVCLLILVGVGLNYAFGEYLPWNHD